MRKLPGTRLAAKALLAMCLAQSAVRGVSAQTESRPAATRKRGEVEVRADRIVKSNVDKFYVLQTSDKREIRDYVTRAFKIEKAWPVDIAGYLQNMVNLEKGFVTYATPPAPPGENPRQPGWVVVTAPDFMMPGIEEVVKSLDYTGFEFNLGDYSLHIKTKNRRPSEIANILKNASVLSAQATVLPDDLTNTLYVADGGAAMEDAEDMIKAFDSPIPQVLIEAQILELNADVTRKLGLDWEAWKNALPANVDVTLNSGKGAGGDASLNAAGVPTRSASLTGMSPQALAQFLEFLTSTGRAQVRSRPRIVAVNGRPAEISSLEAIPFTTIAQPSTDKNANVPAGRERVDSVREVGMRLTVTPMVGAEAINLTVEAQISSLVGYSRDDQPIISQNRASSEASLRNGELFVLGGLSREWTVRENKGVPMLKDVRGLRYLFGKEIDSRKRSEVLVVLRPFTVRADANQPKGEDKKMMKAE